MPNLAFDHSPTITVPGSSTNTALVKWAGTGADTFLDSTIIVGDYTMGLAADTDLVTFSSGTLTIAGTLAATTLTGSGAGITALNGSNIASGTVAVARLGSGSPGSGNFLRGDGSWQAAGGGKVVQHVFTSTGAHASGTTQVPDDNTIPQNTEGVEFMTLAIDPESASNILIITAHANWSHSGTGMVVMSLFQDSTANALASTVMRNDSAATVYSSSLTHRMVAGTASSTTFKIRIGNNASGTMYLNGTTGALFGGALSSSITIMELEPNS